MCIPFNYLESGIWRQKIPYIAIAKKIFVYLTSCEVLFSSQTFRLPSSHSCILSLLTFSTNLQDGTRLKEAVEEQPGQKVSSALH